MNRRSFAFRAATLVPAVVLAVGFGLLLLDAGFRSELVTAWNLLVDGDPEPLREWLRGFGWKAPLVSAMLQVATSLFPPGPSFLVAIANAMVFGALLGGLLTFVTSLIAAAACFGLARLVGRPGVERIVSEKNLRRVDGFMERRGLLAVFLARLIPFINPDVASYAAGVTGIRWLPFLVAVGAGSVPSIVFYSVVGATALQSTGWVVGIVSVSTLLPVLLLYLYRRRLPGIAGDPEEG